MTDFLKAPTTDTIPRRDGVTHSWDADATLEAQFARQLHHLNEIGVALSAERDIDRLLEKILSISRELTGADAGSVFLTQDDEDGSRALYFREAQNDSVNLDSQMTFAVGPDSLAGYVALTGEPLCFEDVYHLSAEAPYKFNPSFDRENGYRTKSLLVVPMSNSNGEILGVLQLLNRKISRDAILCDPGTMAREVLPFDEESLGLAASIASQAAVALENSRLIKSIEELFESFVQASSSAIEDRDPSTSGHSRRVTTLTLGLAHAINQTEDGPFAEVFFGPAALRELRYAGLLHDFGKIGVRENVLTKSHKLEPRHFEGVLARLHLLQLQKQIAGEDFAWMEPLFRLLKRANDPSVTFLPDDEYQQLNENLALLEPLTYRDHDGELQPVLSQSELAALKVRKGSLTPEEFRQIQEHAALSFHFLEQIRWTTDLARVAEIAHCHHEKLGGGGYPRGLLADAIPLQARMMTVADIYDAITANDRPYKRAVPVERALAILRDEVERGDLDGDVVTLFLEREIWKLTQSVEIVGGD